MTAMAPAFAPEQVQALVIQTIRDVLEGNALPDVEDAPFGSGSFEQPEMGQAA